MLQDDKRAVDRGRTYLRGRIFYGPTLALWADCVVRDLNAGGAKLKAPAAQPIPDAFVLLLVSEGVALDCSLRWRKGDLAGVSFSARHDLSLVTGGRLGPIKTLWRSL